MPVHSQSPVTINTLRRDQWSWLFVAALQHFLNDEGSLISNSHVTVGLHFTYMIFIGAAGKGKVDNDQDLFSRSSVLILR